MEDKKRILILLKILDKIPEDNENARKVELYFVFYILVFYISMLIL